MLLSISLSPSKHGNIHTHTSTNNQAHIHPFPSSSFAISLLKLILNSKVPFEDLISGIVHGDFQNLESLFLSLPEKWIQYILWNLFTFIELKLPFVHIKYVHKLFFCAQEKKKQLNKWCSLFVDPNIPKWVFRLKLHFPDQKTIIVSGCTQIYIHTPCTKKSWWWK